MPRRRSTGSSTAIPALPAVNEAIVGTGTGNTNTTISNTNQGESRIMALTANEIQELMGKTRSKGQYLEYLTEFVNSGEGGVCANDQWIAIRDKKATTIKQGFENAKDKKEAPAGSEFVKVINNEDKIYLINLKEAGVEVEAETEAVEA